MTTVAHPSAVNDLHLRLNSLKKMRVCIDGTPLLTSSAGVKTYLYHWVTSLSVSSSNNVATFPRMGPLGSLNHETSIRSPLATNFRLAVVGQMNRSSRISWLAEFLSGPFDVFHTTNLLRNPPRKKALTTTIHDLTTWILPHLHTAENVAADRLFAQRVLKVADRWIAVSHSSKKDAVEILGLPEEKIEVIYHGVAQPYLDVSSEDATRVRSQFGLTRPYILFHGAIEPRKNLDLLLDAYEALPSSIREEFELVISGMMGWALPATIARLKTGSRGIRYLGYVNEQDMPGLTRGASLFVYPSLYEGFGFPVLQAMACGVATITSDVSSLPEIAGGTARLIDPRSVGDLRSAMEELLLSPSICNRLAASGRIRANEFRWEDAADRSWRFFENTIGAM